MRKPFVAEALSGVRQLTAVLPQLTDTEIALVIELEEAALRRETFLNKLYREQRKRHRNQKQRNKPLLKP